MARVTRSKRIQTIVLVLIFVLTAVGTYVYSGKRTQEILGGSDLLMAEASAPVLYLQTESGYHYDYLRGYRDELSARADAPQILAPVSSQRTLNVVVQTYGSEVSALHYELRRLDDQLLEQKDITDFEADGTEWHVQLQFRDLMSSTENSELLLFADMADGTEYTYALQLVPSEQADMDEKLAYFQNFFAAVYDKDRSAEAAAQLYTVPGKNSSSYGEASINSPGSILTWGTLKTVPMREIVPTLTALEDGDCTFDAEYPLLVTDSSDATHIFQVNEQTVVGENRNGELEIMNYDRTAGELFTGANAYAGAHSLNLGVQGGDTDAMDCTVNSTGSDVYFFNQGNLWRASLRDNTLTRIFSYESSDSDGVREDYSGFSGRILMTNEAGDCWFALSGYVNRGQHEGQTGLSVWKYSAAENETAEMLFFPITGTKSDIEEKTGTLMSVSESGVFYLRYGDELLSVGTPGTEVSRETIDFDDDNFVVSADKTQMAYGQGGDAWSASSLRAVNLTDSTASELTAPEGDYIRPIGYIGHDLIYGIAHESDVNEAAGVFAYYKILAVNEAGEEQTSYEPDGSLVVSASIDGARVMLTLGHVSGDGSVTETDEDQLISKGGTSYSTQQSTVSSDEWLQQTVLSFENASASLSDALQVQTVWNITQTEGDTVDLSD